MWSELKELWKFRELLWTSIQRELRIRYKNSIFGALWSLVNPLITVMVMTLVFKVFLSQDARSYTAYILAAYLPFIFFQTAILDSAQSVLGGIHLVKKVYFPREIMPLASIISNFIHLLLAMGVFFAYLLLVWILNPGVSPFQWTAIYLPILLLILLMLTAGLGLLISALTVFYEDVKHIVGVLLYLLLFLCPIMYFSENVYYTVGGRYYFLYHLNPVAAITDAFRKILLAPQNVTTKDGVVRAWIGLDWNTVYVAAIISFLVLILGYSVFNRLKWRFVERP